MPREEKFTFKVLIKKEPDAWVAHCLELNLVTVADTLEQVEADMMDVIAAHVRYALEKDNLDYMFHPAPPEVWKDFFKCSDREETSYSMPETALDDSWSTIPVIQADKCFYRQASHA
jgi:predicted RNase H-like HicB family nuclease